MVINVKKMKSLTHFQTLNHINLLRCAFALSGPAECCRGVRLLGQLEAQGQGDVCQADQLSIT